jgi:hypothetical protein
MQQAKQLLPVSMPIVATALIHCVQPALKQKNDCASVVKVYIGGRSAQMAGFTQLSVSFTA